MKRTFMNTYDEWHATVIGFCEVIAFTKPRFPSSTAQQGYLQEEYHYYVFGRAVGVLAWIGLAFLVKWMFF